MRALDARVNFKQTVESVSGLLRVILDRRRGRGVVSVGFVRDLCTAIVDVPEPD